MRIRSIKIYFRLIIIVVGITTFNELSAQEINSVETIKTDSSIQFLSPTEYAFMMHEETNWLFKVGAFFGPEHYTNYGGSSIGASVEARIAKSFTLDLGTGLSFINSSTPAATRLLVNSNSNLSLRWYYKLNEQRKKLGVKNHMSGNYFFANVGYTSLNFIADDGNQDIIAINHVKERKVIVGLGWGLQRRFLGKGYLNMGISSGLEMPIASNGETSFYLSSSMSVGFAFAKDKYNLNQDQLCPVIKCHESASLVFKSNFLNVINITLESNTRDIYIRPNIIVEKKIGASPFSLQANAIVGINYYYRNDRIYSSSYFDYGEGSNLQLEGGLEARWYYNLKKRILKGKTGNGLSANYIGLGAQHTYNSNNNLFNNNVTFYYVNTGIQRFFYKSDRVCH